MAKPNLSKRFMTQEGLNDFEEYQLPDDQKIIDDADVMRVAALVCNSLPYSEVDMPSQLWIAPSSMGLRETDGLVVTRLVQETVGGDEDIYSYDGYDIRSATSVVLGSATSGAIIDMRRHPQDSSEWVATFTDPTGESHMYRRIFSHLGHSSLHDLIKPQIFWDEYQEPYDLTA